MGVFRTNDYAGNGLADGLARGIGLSSAYNQMKAQKGLASGMSKVANGDESGWNEIAEADPSSYLQYKMAKEKMANDLEKQKIQRTFNTTNEIKNMEYLVGQGYSPEEARNIAFKPQNKTQSMNPFERKRIENAASKIDENISKAQERVALYDRANQLLDNGVETGGITGYYNKTKPTEWQTSDEAEFGSIVNKLVPQQRPAGSGTTSDRDMEIYRKATIGFDKDKQANKNILALGKAMAENDVAYEENRAEWINNGGNLSDFDKLWRQYVNEQRIYNEDGSINRNRINPYDYFSGNIEAKQKDNDPLGLR